MSAHVFYSCQKPCPNPGTCRYCDGALAYCVTCKGAEGTLPTDCPEKAMPEAVQEAVMRGNIDYKKDRWIICHRHKAKI